MPVPGRKTASFALVSSGSSLRERKIMNMKGSSGSGSRTEGKSPGSSGAGD
jgi:hypothetical protein